jgi:hypothetical protein
MSRTSAGELLTSVTEELDRKRRKGFPDIRSSKKIPTEEEICLQSVQQLYNHIVDLGAVSQSALYRGMAVGKDTKIPSPNVESNHLDFRPFLVLLLLDLLLQTTIHQPNFVCRDIHHRSSVIGFLVIDL